MRPPFAVDLYFRALDVAYRKGHLTKQGLAEQFAYSVHRPMAQGESWATFRWSITPGTGDYLVESLSDNALGKDAAYALVPDDAHQVAVPSGDDPSVVAVWL